MTSNPPSLEHIHVHTHAQGQNHTHISINHTMACKAGYRNGNTVDHAAHHLGLIAVTALLLLGSGKVLEGPFPHLAVIKYVVRLENTHTHTDDNQTCISVKGEEKKEKKKKQKSEGYIQRRVTTVTTVHVCDIHTCNHKCTHIPMTV